MYRPTLTILYHMAHYQTWRQFTFYYKTTVEYKLYRYSSPQGIVSDPVKVFTLRKFCIFSCESCNCIYNFTLSILVQIYASSLFPNAIVYCLQRRACCITQVVYKLSLCLRHY